MMSKKLLAIAAISTFALCSAHADQSKEKSDEMRAQAEDAASEQRTRRVRMSEEQRAEIDDDARSKADGSKNKGNEKAQEMRARRDERKEIMDATKSDSKADDHYGDNDDGRASDDDGEGKGKAKEKKAWWKFWGD